jgi:hypothetical protein
MWQTPGFMLKLATFCFLLGLLILVWDAAKASDVQWSSDDMKVGGLRDRQEQIANYQKIATLFTAAAGVSFVLYAMSVFGLFFKTVE